MKKFLRYINSMPFRFTMRHYQIFGDSTTFLKDHELNSPQSWDALRKEHPFFSIADTREEWLKAAELEIKKDGQDKDLIRRAEDIASLLKRENIARIFSVGSGGAALEYQLKRSMPSLHIVCSDYSPVTVARLKKVFLEADEVIEFDVITGDWRKVEDSYLGPNGVCLMYRIDAGFSDDEWSFIFRRMSEAGIQRVLVVPTGTLTMLSVYNRKSRELRWRFRSVPRVWSGYVRTQKSFQAQWRRWYRDRMFQFGGLKGFLLTNSTKAQNAVKSSS